MPNINWIENSQDAQRCLPGYMQEFGEIGAWLYMDSKLDSWLDSEFPVNGEHPTSKEEVRQVVRTYLRSNLGHLFLTRKLGRIFYRPIIKSHTPLNFLSRLLREKRIVINGDDRDLMKKNYWRDIVAEEIDIFMSHIPDNLKAR